MQSERVSNPKWLKHSEKNISDRVAPNVESILVKTGRKTGRRLRFVRNVFYVKYISKISSIAHKN
jgi:hypothetical protein